MNPKQILLEVAESLPPEATLYDAIRELEFRHRVLHGLTLLDSGQRIPLEETQSLISEWITKSTSLPKLSLTSRSL